jgi:signal transduction histidine kinase/CheY-like chemotaxis protein
MTPDDPGASVQQDFTDLVGPLILIVEDNAIARKMFRLALNSSGFRVAEAGTAASALASLQGTLPQLVVMDMALPDMDGFALARRIRELPGSAEIPVIAVTGYAHLLENARLLPDMFDACLFKPVEPGRLIATVREYLPDVLALAGVDAALPSSAHILIVDDNPVQLRLARLGLSRYFARISTATSAISAVALARSDSPDLILTDLVMREEDGFDLCLAVRRDRALDAMPVVVFSAHHADAQDHDLARRVGASLLLPRTTDFEGLATALIGVMTHAAGTVADAATEPPVGLRLELDRRARSALERQTILNVQQAKRTALQGAQISLLSGVADALTQSTDVEATLGEVLSLCLDAGEIYRGALFRRVDDNLHLSHSVGFADGDIPALHGFFGHPSLLARALVLSGALPITSPPLQPEEARSFLASAGTVSALLIPLVGRGRCLGALLLGASVASPDRAQVSFCLALGSYIAQALALTEAFARERSARAAAEAANRAKSDFLTLVSHELRTPLTNIGLQLGLFERDAAEGALSPRQQQRLKLLSKAEERLSGLVRTLLEYAMVESSLRELAPALVDVRVMLEAVLADLRPRADAKQIALLLACPHCHFRTDSRLYQLIVSNLVDNAIKFTDKGQVTLSVVMSTAGLILTVDDTGRGIPIGEQVRIFTPFEQMEEVAHKHTPGVGLGLALVKRLVEGLGGTVKVASHPGGGSRFTVFTPELVPQRQMALRESPRHFPGDEPSFHAPSHH